MANPFQDQLLKAGLVSKDKVNKVNKSKHKQAKQQPKNQATEAEERKRQIQQEAQLKAERDRALNQQKVEEENKKALQAQVRQLVEMNRLTDIDGELAYHFNDNGKVRQVYVTEDVRKKIVSGQLAIVRPADKYELVPKQVAEKIAQRDAGFVIVCNTADQASEEDDEYADFKVPDDLMW